MWIERYVIDVENGAEMYNIFLDNMGEFWAAKEMLNDKNCTLDGIPFDEKTVGVGTRSGRAYVALVFLPGFHDMVRKVSNEGTILLRRDSDENTVKCVKLWNGEANWYPLTNRTMEQLGYDIQKLFKRPLTVRIRETLTTYRCVYGIRVRIFLKKLRKWYQ